MEGIWCGLRLEWWEWVLNGEGGVEALKWVSAVEQPTSRVEAFDVDHIARLCAEHECSFHAPNFLILTSPSCR